MFARKGVASYMLLVVQAVGIGFDAFYNTIIRHVC